jgi:hypothetical protein
MTGIDIVQDTGIRDSSDKISRQINVSDDMYRQHDDDNDRHRRRHGVR